MSDKIDQFWQLVNEISDILVTQDYSACESRLKSLVNIVRSEQELQESFEEAFLTVFDNPDRYSVLPVIYCMRFLKFPRIREHAESRLESHPYRIDTHADLVLSAYSDNWCLEGIFDEK